MDSILWLYNQALCVWLFFPPRLVGSLVCRFLWVIGPHSARVTSQAWRRLSSSEIFPFISSLAIFLVLALLISLYPPAPHPKTSLYLYFFPLKPTNGHPFSVSLSPFLPAPCLCVVIESSCDEVTIVHREQILEEGPGFVWELQFPKMRASDCPQGTSVRKLKVCTLVGHNSTCTVSILHNSKATESWTMESREREVCSLAPCPKWYYAIHVGSLCHHSSNFMWFMWFKFTVSRSVKLHLKNGCSTFTLALSRVVVTFSLCADGKHSPPLTTL